MSTDDLDSFTLTRIFSYLSVEDIVLSVRLTCKRWKEISHDPHLWKMIWNERAAKEFEYMSYHAKTLKQIDLNAAHFKSLIFDYETALDIEDYVYQNSSARSLKYLHNINTDTIEKLLRRYPNLNRFSFNFEKDTHVRQLSLLRIPNIKKLTIKLSQDDGCCRRFGQQQFLYETSSMGLQDFIRNHPTLEGIYTNIILQESTLDILLESCSPRSITISTTIPSIATCSQLDSHPTLTLRKIRLHGGAIRDLHLQNLCSNVKHLRDLSIVSCLNISNEAFRKISMCRELDTLFVKECATLTPDVYTYISMCSSIKKISIDIFGKEDMFDVSPVFMCVILNKWTTKVTDFGLQALASACIGLRELHIPECKRITDLGVMAIADHCPRLVILNISGCKNVTDYSLLALAEQSHDLHTLLLNDCYHFTEVGVGPLIAKCRNLRKLAISNSGYLHNLHLDGYLDLPGKFDGYIPSSSAATCRDPGTPVRDKGFQTEINHICLCRKQYHELDSPSNEVGTETRTSGCSKLASITDPRDFRESFRELKGTADQQSNATSNHKEMDDDQISNMKEGSKTQCRLEHHESLKSSEKVREISPARENFLKCLSDSSLPSTRQHSLITHLNLRYCASLDDQSFAQIVFHCPDLRVLDIGECSKLTDASLFSIARNSHVLQVLFMTKLTQCTMKGLLQLIESLNLLEEIAISLFLSHTAITATDIKNLHGKKSGTGKYIKADNSFLRSLSRGHCTYDKYEVTLNLVCDAAFKRTSLNHIMDM